MPFDAHRNFAVASVATAPSPATSGTSLVVGSGEGTKLPTAPFNAVVWPNGIAPTTLNAEVVRVTNVSTDTLTITRSQESSSARAIITTDQIAAAITAKMVTDIETAVDAALLPGTSVVKDLTSGLAEQAIPYAAAVVGASKTYVKSDRGKVFQRSNTGSSMGDTLPNNLAVGDNGWWIKVDNIDSAADLTMGSGAGVFANGTSSAIHVRSTRQTYVWTGTGWRFDAGNGNLLKITPAGTANPVVSGNVPKFSDVTGRTVTDGGFKASKVVGAYFDIVADGGADPTGVADCTSIIEAAHVTVAAAGGGIVFYPVGTYRVASTVDLIGNFVTHRGANRVSSLIKRDFATGDTIKVGNGTANTGIFTRFEFLRIQGSSSTIATSGAAINFLVNSSNCATEGVDVIYHWGGIQGTGQLLRLNDMNIREMGANAVGGYGILFDAFTDQYTAGIVMDNPVPPFGNIAGGPNGFAGIRITNLSSLLMFNMQVIHCGVGLDVKPTGTNSVPSIYGINCFFDQCVYGADFGGSSSGNTTRCRFMQCWFSSCTTAGVRLNFPRLLGIDFLGCEFYGSPVGFDVVDATEWTIRASKIAGNTTAGIRVAVGTVPHAFSITDNFIGDQGAGFGANGVGITIGAGTYSRYQILDNRGLDTNTTKGITDLGTVVGEGRKNVANNMGAGLLEQVLSVLTTPLAPPIAETLLIPTLTIPAGLLKLGTMIRVSGLAVIGTIGNPTLRVRLGTLGTTADPVIHAVANTGMVVTGAAAGIARFDVDIVVRAVPSAASAIHAFYRAQHNAAVATPVQSVANFNTSVDLKLSVTGQMSAGTVTWQQVAVEVVRS